jgi:hypothetical protein
VTEGENLGITPSSFVTEDFHHRMAMKSVGVVHSSPEYQGGYSAAPYHRCLAKARDRGEPLSEEAFTASLDIAGRASVEVGPSAHVRAACRSPDLRNSHVPTVFDTMIGISRQCDGCPIQPAIVED